MVREPDATMQLTPQDNQLMPKHRILSFKPQLRLEWRGQDGQNETEQPDHSANLGDSITASTRVGFRYTQPQISSVVNLVAAELRVAMIPASMSQLSVAGVTYRAIAGDVPKTILALACRRGEITGNSQFSRRLLRPDFLEWHAGCVRWLVDS
jgi:hypothetical protein